MSSPRVLERKVYYVGDKVFREGDRGECAYVVEQGEVEVSKHVNGEDVVIGRVEKGGIFGEMALIDDMPRMATVRAATQTVLITVPRDAFHAKLVKTDPFIRGLLSIFVKNIRAMTDDKLAERGGD